MSLTLIVYLSKCEQSCFALFSDFCYVNFVLIEMNGYEIYIYIFYLLFIVWSLGCSLIWDLVLGKNYLGSLLSCILFGISGQMFKEWIALKKKKIMYQANGGGFGSLGNFGFLFC